MSDTAPLLAAASRPPPHLRIVLLGPPSSGKSLLYRSRLPATTTGAAAAPPAATTAPDFCVCTVPLRGRQQRLQLWDTPGCSRAASLPLLKGAHAAALVCSVLSAQGPAALAQWLPAAAAANGLHNGVPAAMIVVGHGGGDGGTGGSSSARDEARALAAAHSLPYVAVDSAADVEGLFAALGEAALRTHAQMRAQEAPPEAASAAAAAGAGACCPCWRRAQQRS
jgi:hypothetical protein